MNCCGGNNLDKNRKISENEKPKKALLVYINRLEMKELDNDNNYNFIPDIVDKDGNIIDVKVSYNEGYAEQMLRYSKEFANLPYRNE